MPSSLTGLLMFVVLLAPGLSHALAAERMGRPARMISVFRETAGVVLTSVFANAVVLALFAVLRAVWPSGTPDVRSLVADPVGYWRDAYALLAAWAALLVGLACLLGYLWGAHQLGRRLADRLGDRKLGRLLVPPAQVEFVSAWQHLLRSQHEDSYRHVRCRFGDGTEVAGWLQTFNHDAHESGDRELVLGAPLRFIDARGREEWRNAGAVAVSARQLQWLEVAYFATGPEEDPNEDPAKGPGGESAARARGCRLRGPAAALAAGVVAGRALNQRR